VNILKATRRYERWLGRHIRLVPADLRLKHRQMAAAAFPFLRATFYRWTQVFPDTCPDVAKAPRVLAVGDLHVENFGTWRDIEGRLVWGVNDFDEVAELPYTNDLVRLATSAVLAISEGHLKLNSDAACSAILEGYGNSLHAGGRPFVLEEEHSWLRRIATGELRDPVHFWAKMDSLSTFRGKLPTKFRAAIERTMPERGLQFRTVRRVAGLGSLGHERFVAIAECHGGRIAREAKALAPSSVLWATDARALGEILYQEVLAAAVRDPDPFVHLRQSWLVRRLSPHCSRIELSVLPKDRDELRLLSAMGWETANIHLGSKTAPKKLRPHFKSLEPKWLASASRDMADAVLHDWRVWKKASQS
jgi:uncharacterized protein (DUF2252 family)